MGVSFVGFGTYSASSTADPTPGLHASSAAGDLLVLCVTTKYSSVTPDATGSGYTLMSTATGSSGSTGNDTGTIKTQIWIREMVGGDTGPTVVVGTADNVTQAQVITLRKASTETWDFGATDIGGGDTTSGTSTAISLGSDTYQLDDWVVLYMGFPGNNFTTYSSRTLTWGGTVATSGGVTTRVNDATSAGTDGAHNICTAVITTAGTDTATYTIVTDVATMGSGNLLRVRAVPNDHFVDVNQATETDTADWIRRTKFATVNQATETDVANVINVWGDLPGLVPEAIDFIGPICDTNGNLYAITESTPGVSGNKHQLFKSSDAGGVWTEIDAAGKPSTDDLEAVYLLQDREITGLVHVLHQDSSENVSYHSFGTSDHATDADQWITVDSGALSFLHDTTADFPPNQNVGMVQLSNGDIYAFYQADGELVSSVVRQRIHYKISTNNGATWGSDNILDTGTTNSMGQLSVVVGKDDKIHLFAVEAALLQVWHRSLPSGGSWGSWARVDTGGLKTTYMHPMTNAVYQNMGGVERIHIAWLNNSNQLYTAYIDNDGSPTTPVQVTTDTVDFSSEGNHSVHAYLTTLGSTVHCLYVSLSTGDIYRTNSVNGAAFDTPVELHDGITGQWIWSNVYTRAGKKRLGYLYDAGGQLVDVGDLWFNELNLGFAVTVGQVTEAETAQVITPEQGSAYLIDVLQASETDTSNAFTRLKSKTFAQTTETETAQAFTRLKGKAAAQASETDTANVITPTVTRRYVAVNQITETDTSQTFTKRKSKTIGQVAETDSVNAITPTVTRRYVPMSIALEVETAQGISELKTKAIGQVSETDSAQAFSSQLNKYISLNPASETDSVNAFSVLKKRTVGQVTEAEHADPIRPHRYKAVGQVTETDAANTISPRHSKIFGSATETDTSQGVSRRKSSGLGQATEIDTAGTLAFGGHFEAVNLTTETDTAQAITVYLRRYIAVGQASETDTAQAISEQSNHFIAVGQVSETDTAQAFTAARGRAVSLGQATGGDITPVVLTSAISQTDATSYTTTSVSPAGKKTLLLLVSTSSAAGTSPDPTVSGLGLTWTAEANFLFSGTTTFVRRLKVYSAVTSGTPASGAITIDTAGVTSTHCSHVLLETNADLSDPVLQAVTGSAASGGTGTLSFAAASTARTRAISFWLHRVNEAITPRAGWTELAELITTSPNTAVEVQWREDAFETPSTATWTTTTETWGGVGLELAPGSSNLALPVRPTRRVTMSQVSETDSVTSLGKKKSKVFGFDQRYSYGDSTVNLLARQTIATPTGIDAGDDGNGYWEASPADSKTWDFRDFTALGYFDCDSAAALNLYPEGRFNLPGAPTNHQTNSRPIRLGYTTPMSGPAYIGGKIVGDQPILGWEDHKHGSYIQGLIDDGMDADEAYTYIIGNANMDGDPRVYFDNGSWAVIDGMRCKNTWDGLGVYGTGTRTQTGTAYFRNCWLYQYRDDGIENDQQRGLHLLDCLFEDGRTFLSTRASDETGSPVVGNEQVVEDCIVKLVAQPGGHKLASTESTWGYFWKGQTNSPYLTMRNTILACEDGYNYADGVVLPERAGDSYENVAICWLGTGAYPGNTPSGVTVYTGVTAQALIDDSIAVWKTRHGVTDFDTVNMSLMISPLAASEFEVDEAFAFGYYKGVHLGQVTEVDSVYGLTVVGGDQSRNMTWSVTRAAARMSVARLATPRRMVIGIQGE